MRFANHARMYDTARLPETPALLRARARDLANPATVARVGGDLLRWLPKEHAQLACAPNIDTVVATACSSLEAAAEVLAGQPELLAMLAAEGREKGPTGDRGGVAPARPGCGTALDQPGHDSPIDCHHVLS